MHFVLIGEFDYGVYLYYVMEQLHYHRLRDHQRQQHVSKSGRGVMGDCRREFREDGRKHFDVGLCTVKLCTQINLKDGGTGPPQTHHLIQFFNFQKDQYMFLVLVIVLIFAFRPYIFCLVFSLRCFSFSSFYHSLLPVRTFGKCTNGCCRFHIYKRVRLHRDLSLLNSFR